jgi:hypothetical protein
MHVRLKTLQLLISPLLLLLAAAYIQWGTVGGHHLSQRRSSDWIVGVRRVRL